MTISNSEMSTADILNAAADLIEAEGYNKIRAAVPESAATEFVPGHGYTVDEALDFARLGRVMANAEEGAAPQELKAAYVLAGDEMFRRQTGEEKTFLDILTGNLAFKTTDWLATAEQDDVITLLRSVAQRELDEGWAA